MPSKKSLVGCLAFLAVRSRFPDIYSSLRSWHKHRVAIIAYHRIRDEGALPSGLLGMPTAQELEEQLSYLHDNYEIIALPELVKRLRSKKPLPKRGAVITFDDGHRDCYLHAYPILRKYAIPATIFLTTGYIDTNSLPWWDKVAHMIGNTTLASLDLGKLGKYPLSSAPNRLKATSRVTRRLKRLPEEEKNQLIRSLVNMTGANQKQSEATILSWQEVEEMSRHDITFGAHTVSHPILTRIPKEQAEQEIRQSKRDIEEHLGKEVNLFAYPNGERGDFDNEVKGLLRDNGFAAAVSLISGINTASTDLYELRRFAGYGGGLDVFRVLISGAVPGFLPPLLAKWYY